MHLRLWVFGIVVAVVGASGGAQARQCETVEACVAIARKTPTTFAAVLQPLLSQLSTEALLAGLEVELSPPALTERVRGFVGATLPPRALTDTQRAHLMARFLATEGAVADRYRGPLHASREGQKLLFGYIANHDDARAQQLAHTLLASQAGTPAERARCVVLVWQAYQKIRGKPDPGHDDLMNFMGNRPDDFAERARVLATVAVTNGAAPLYDDLDLMIRQPRPAMVMTVASWAARHPVARQALFSALESAELGLVEGVSGAPSVGLEALLTDAMASTQANDRVHAVNVARRAYPMAKGKLTAPAAIAAAVIGLAADVDAGVRQSAFRVLDEWSDHAAAREALVAAVHRFDREAVQHMLVARGPALQPWRQAELLFVLRELPAMWWGDPAWQHTIVQAGLAIERSRKKRYGFDAFQGELVGMCGNDRIAGLAGQYDLEILDPEQHAAWKAKQPKPPTVDEQARTLATRRDQLRAARDKLVGGKS